MKKIRIRVWQNDGSYTWHDIPLRTGRGDYSIKLASFIDDLEFEPHDRIEIKLLKD